MSKLHPLKELNSQNLIDINSLLEKIKTVSIKIEGKEYLVDFSSIISFKNFNELSDLKLEESLEKISSWLFTLVNSIVQLRSELKSLKRKYKNWELSLINASKVYGKSVSNSNLIYQDSNFKDNEIRMSEIDSTESTLELMEDLYEILKQRNETLRSLLKRRSETKFGKGREQGA